MKGKKASINTVLNEVEPDIALFCETLLRDDKGIQIEGLTFFGRVGVNGPGGSFKIC